jgi:hypothetical protein
MSIRLKIAAYAGLLSLILIPPEIFLEQTLKQYPDELWLYYSVILIYVLTVLTTVLVYYGFYLIGNHFSARAIKISSLIIILLNFVWYTFQVVILEQPVTYYNIFGGTVLVVFGFSRILFGYGLYMIQDKVGQLAKPMAILEVVIGLFLISVIYYLGGFVLSLVVAVMQIILLLRLSKILGESTTVLR